MKSRVNPELIKLAREAIRRAKKGGLKKRAFVPMSPAGVAPAPAGAPMPPPPMDPAAMGGAPMDPAAMGGAPMDPAAMGGAPMDPAAMGGAPMPPEGGAAPGGEMMTVALPDLIQLFTMVAQQSGGASAGGPTPAPSPEPEKKLGAGGGKDQKLDMIMSKLDTLIGALGMADMMAPAESGAAMPPPDMGGENALAPSPVDMSGAAPPPPTGGMTVAASMRKLPIKQASLNVKSDVKSRALSLSRICSNLRSDKRR